MQTSTPTAIIPVDAEQLIPDRKVREMLGGISDMTLWRLDHDSTSGFPKPIRPSGKRKFRRLSELRAWIDAKARESIRSLDRPGQPRRAA